MEYWRELTRFQDRNTSVSLKKHLKSLGFDAYIETRYDCYDIKRTSVFVLGSEYSKADKALFEWETARRP